MPQAICAFCQKLTEHEDASVVAEGIMTHVLQCDKHPMSKLTDLLIETGVELGLVVEKCRAAAEAYREGGSVQDVIGTLDSIVESAGPMLTAEDVQKRVAAEGRS